MLMFYLYKYTYLYVVQFYSYNLMDLIFTIAFYRTLIMTMTSSSSTQDWLGADSLISRMGGVFFIFKIICLKNDHILARFRLSWMFYHDL